ncbi:acyltransferase [Microvirga soli]|uniref:acyltransferase n=1 Tax=Microvirga soli TaxID=1854496 RepID=UPI00191D574A|nr:hypothetical protein [Microvirga soli]
MLERIRAIIQAAATHVTMPDKPFSPIEKPDAGVALWNVRDGAEVLSDGICSFSDNAKIVATAQGAKVYLSESAELEGTHIIAQGRGCLVFIGPGCRLRKATIKVWGSNCAFIIGAGTTWESGSGLCSMEDQYVVIGDDCMISNSVLIRTDDGHGIFDRQTHERINTSKPVVIEPHVWLGNGSRVNKGARIETGAILASAAIASGRLEGHSIYAGTPAKKLKSDVAWSRTFSWDDIPDDYR